MHVDDVALPRGTTIAVADLFFNTPARRKFLRAESTELAHVTALVTHYALVHPDKHFELLSATHTIVSAPPVTRTAERIYQIFGKDTLGQLLPVAAEAPLERAGLPEPPPWKKDPDEPKRDPGTLRLTGFFSKPELQKLNRNSIYIFVNKRLIRDRLLMHAITEAYRNVIPPTSFPVVLLFLEMPPEEVDVNVHPAKTEVRFRQQSHVHDFVRDSLRMALIKARPAAGFLAALDAQPTASPSLMPPATSPLPGRRTQRFCQPDSDPQTLEDRPIGRRALPVDPAAAHAGSRQPALWRRAASGQEFRSRRPGARRQRPCFSRRPARTESCSPTLWAGFSANGQAGSRDGAGRGRAGACQPEPPGLAQAPGAVARVVHFGHRRRRIVDYRPACGPRTSSF
jgi:DNA mismatch repair ATPase MutL